MLPFSRTNSGDNFSSDVNQRSSEEELPPGPARESFLNTIKKLPCLQKVEEILTTAEE